LGERRICESKTRGDNNKLNTKGADLEMSVRITKYEQAFDLICRAYNDEARQIIKQLENEGHTEKSICYSVWRGQDNLFKNKHDKRFWGIFINTVRKWSWPKGDPRWDEYWKRKKEEKKAKQIKDEMEKAISESTYRKRKYQMRYPGYIYFVQGECGGPIKIGYSTDIEKRIKTLQTGYPDVLGILYLIPGDMADEEELHKELAYYRMRGEWFKPDEEVLRKIEFLKQNIEPAIKAKYDINFRQSDRGSG